jgi:hypothetical protein
VDFKDLLDYCKAEAISNTLLNTEISVWRSLCRDYSERFSTPLHMCLNGEIPAEDILLAVFEDQLKKFDPETDLDAMMEQIYRIEDPDFDEKLGEELKEFMAKVAEEEAERIRLGKPIHKALKQEVELGKNTSEKKPPEPPKKSGGHINLAYLQREEINETGGFE